VQPYPQLLRNVHSHLQRNGHSQRPQLTSSQAFDVNAKSFNPCGDIVANSNPTLGRHFRKSKHPRRDFGDAFDDMLDVGLTTGLAAAMLPSILDMGGSGMPQGVDLFGGGPGMLDGFGGGEEEFLAADGGDLGEDGGGLMDNFFAFGGLFVGDGD